MCLATLPRLATASPPRVAMATSAFFAATFIGIPFAGTHVHLVAVGLSGVLLGAAAFPSVVVGLVLQRLLLQYGGLATLGVNATTLGVGALVAAAVFHLGRRPEPPLDDRARRRLAWRAGFAGGLGTLVSLVLYGGALLTAEAALAKVAWVCLVAHAPVLVVEALMTGLVVGFLARVQPDLLGLSPAPVSPGPPREPGGGPDGEEAPC